MAEVYLPVCDTPILIDGSCPTIYNSVTAKELLQSSVFLDQSGYEQLVVPTILLLATAFGIKALRKTIEPKV